MTQKQTQLAWVRGYTSRGAGDEPGTQTADYRLTDLVKRGFMTAKDGHGLLFAAGLADLAWQLMWADNHSTSDAELENRLNTAQGYALFMHGWTGNHLIWENIPGMVVTANPNLVALSVDHNGFGASPFVDAPTLENCSPPAAMHVMEGLVEVLKLRRQPGQPNLKVINFVGHSMGGTALFYLNPINWRIGEETRVALAPALLLDDEVKRIFYTALGIGIGLVNRIQLFELIERAIKPQVLDALTVGASVYVRQIHSEQYKRTARATTATTFMAMGLLNNREIPRRWDTFRVLLGHRDPLVGLLPMMDMLSRLEFPASNMRVVAGSHYFFSIGSDTVFAHAQNRELVVQDILELHERAYLLQKTGKRIG
jgi:pimeloyl-ACP methyl ester carboxylesterase